MKNNMGADIPCITFYSAQGGVGKSTLARKFAELVTVAPGNGGLKPNVLLVDLDPDSSGLTHRLWTTPSQNIKTVHEVIAHREVAGVQGIDVTMSVSLASGNPQERGKLYLIPSAPPDAKLLFKTIAEIETEKLLSLLKNLIQTLINQNQISCVVLDCSPGANPYAAAAATIADVPLMIGRNEEATYKNITILPTRFREIYPSFQPALQRVIINAVSVKDFFAERSKQYTILDYIPLTSDIIYETEGLSRTGSFRLLLFEKYVVDIIEKVLTGNNHLIPQAPEVVGKEWAEAIDKLEHSNQAPKMVWLKYFSTLRWVGIGLVIVGITFWGSRRVFEKLPMYFTRLGIGSVFIGLVSTTGGWHAKSESHRISSAAKDLGIKGPDGILKMLKEGGAAERKQLDELKQLADSIPRSNRQIPNNTYSSN